MTETTIVALLAVAAPICAIGGYLISIGRWRGDVDRRITQGEKDRETIHERISTKEAERDRALEKLSERVDKLAEHVAALQRGDVAILIERLKHD